MNGFTFVPRRTSPLHAIWEQRELRLPAIALTAAVAAVAFAGGIERGRVSVEHGRAERAQAELDLLEARVSAVRRLETRAREDHALAGRVLAVRFSAVTRASEIAEIGNRLAGEAWLSELRHDASGWRITGGAARLSGVSATILALRPLSGDAEALQSVSEATDAGGGRHLQYELSLGARRP